MMLQKTWKSILIEDGMNKRMAAKDEIKSEENMKLSSERIIDNDTEETLKKSCDRLGENEAAEISFANSDWSETVTVQQ
ncbi:hypothetical protein DPMN_145509 [Dreissena polymorpha]|uniref:Uncharacterized protein n=1 Tax=Dreissena polymorpha TaxID=45954 RepID=A0A9D4IYW1_DREPO|nr:hypothetical protein DPMN_145509 [Dreissena polymorpha]